MLLERELGKWLVWWTEGNVSVLQLSKSEVKWSEVKGSAVKGVIGAYREGYLWVVKWSEVKGSAVKGVNLGVP